MVDLKHSKVFRGGSTAPNLTFESSACQMSASRSEDALEFNFTIASKGGGNTDVLLRIGRGDVAAILEEIATQLPDTAVLLSDSASIAVESSLKQFDKTQAEQAVEIARVKSSVNESLDNLIQLANFITSAVACEFADAKKMSEKYSLALGSLRRALSQDVMRGEVEAFP